MTYLQPVIRNHLCIISRGSPLTRTATDCRVIARSRGYHSILDYDRSIKLPCRLCFMNQKSQAALFRRNISSVNSDGYTGNWLFFLSSTTHMDQNILMTKRPYSMSRASRTLSYYDILETTPSASQKQIKAAYFRLSKKLHPDVNSASDAKEQFSMLSEAYEILGNRRTRALYDAGSLSPADVHSPRGTAADNTGPVDEEYREFFRRKGSQFRSRGGTPPTGRTNIYDFDEFYRQHYGDSMRRKAEWKYYKEEMDREDAEMVEKAKRRAVLFGLMTLGLVGFLLTIGSKR